MTESKKSFEQIVGGRIAAEILLDEKGEPMRVAGGSLKHYKVRLFLKTDNQEVRYVTYTLDPTYHDPVRESQDAGGQFAVELTTYGDYPVTVDAQVGGQTLRKVVPLSKLLEQNYRETTDSKIQSVLQEIKQH